MEIKHNSPQCSACRTDFIYLLIFFFCVFQASVGKRALCACLRSPEIKKKQKLMRVQHAIKNSVPASYLPPLCVIHVWMSLKYENDNDLVIYRSRVAGVHRLKKLNKLK